MATYTTLLLHDLLLCMYELIFFMLNMYIQRFDKSPCLTMDKQFERDIILNRRVWSFLSVVHLRFALPKIPAKLVVKFAIVSSTSTPLNWHDHYQIIWPVSKIDNSVGDENVNETGDDGQYYKDECKNQVFICTRVYSGHE